MTRRVVVVGGGLTGLATGWWLRDEVDLTVVEAAERAGGQVHTADLAGTAVDVGADAFLTRQPEGPRLLRSLGFSDDDLVSPATGHVLLWLRGRLRPMPAGTVLGVPADLVALARSGALTPPGTARAAVEPLLPRRHVAGDRSVADLVGERFGREVVVTLVEPLLGGVYAGSAERLSAAATLPAVWEAAARHRSLVAGLRARPAPAPGPVFVTVRGGLGRVVDRLAADLGDRILTGRSVTGLARTPGGWSVSTGDGDLDADVVVVAVPPHAAARLLADEAPAAARELVGIRTASVAVVALAYDRSDAEGLPPASGILVPRAEGRLVKAVTLTSRKWHHRAGPERFLVRASVGRVDDPSGLDLDDDTLARRADAEVRQATGIAGPAVERVVMRWPDALPQYEVGHLQRVDRLRMALEPLDGLHLGGAALDGLGLSARARDAERLAGAVRAGVAA